MSSHGPPVGPHGVPVGPHAPPPHGSPWGLHWEQRASKLRRLESEAPSPARVGSSKLPCSTQSLTDAAFDRSGVESRFLASSIQSLTDAS